MMGDSSDADFLEHSRDNTVGWYSPRIQQLRYCGYGHGYTLQSGIIGWYSMINIITHVARHAVS